VFLRAAAMEKWSYESGLSGGRVRTFVPGGSLRFADRFIKAHQLLQQKLKKNI
jgi:hypothetical protein